MNAITRNILRLNPNYINNLKEGQVTEKDISFALKNGYTITEETPQFIIDIASFIDDIQTKPLSEKILTNIVKVNPKFINKLKENQVTYEMLNIALYKGYEFDKETPDFLYKYYSNKEYDLGQKELNVEQFRYYLMGIDYKYNSNFNCPFSLDGLGDEDYKKAIDIIKQNISKFNFYDSLLNNKELTYYYIEKLGFHNFSYSDYKKIYEYTDDYERLFNIIQNSNSNFDFSEINTELLRVWVKHDPKILLEDKLRWHIDSIDQIVGDVINLGILSYEDFKDKNITHNNAVVDILLQHDFSLIKHVKCTDTNFLLQQILKDIPNNLKYIEFIPKEDWHLDDTIKDAITSAILSSNVSLNNCNLEFINSNKDVMYHMIIVNPNILKTYSNIWCDFDSNQEQEIIKQIEEKRIVVEDDREYLKQDSLKKINTALAINNPRLVEIVDYISCNKEEVLEKGYEIPIFSNSNFLYSDYDRNYIKKLLIAVDKNIDILNRKEFKITILDDNVERELLNIIHKHNYHITNNSSDILFRLPLVLLDGLINKSISLNDIKKIYLSNEVSSHNILFDYLYKNYSKEELVDLNLLNHYFSNNLELISEKSILNELIKDFSNSLYYEDSIKDPTIKTQIYNLYISDYENNKKYFTRSLLLKKNPQIALYEFKKGNTKNIDYTIFDYNLPKEIVDNLDNTAELNNTILFKMEDELKKRTLETHPNLLLQYEKENDYWDRGFGIKTKLILELISEKKLKITDEIISENFARDMYDWFKENDVNDLKYLIRKLEYRDHFEDIYMLLTSKICDLDFFMVNMNRYDRIRLIKELDASQLLEIFNLNQKNLSYFIDEKDYIIKKDSRLETLFEQYEENNLLDNNILDNLYKQEFSKNPKLVLYLKGQSTSDVIKYVHDDFAKKYLFGEIKIDSDNINYILYEDMSALDGIIDEQVLEYIRQNESIEEFLYIWKEANSYDAKIIGRLLEGYSFEEKLELLRKANIDSDYIYIFSKEELYKISPNYVPSDKLYDYWVENGRNLENALIFFDETYDFRFIIDSLNKDINISKKFWSTHDKILKLSKKYESELFNLFEKNKDKVTIFDSSLFYYNDLIKDKYYNEEYKKENFILKDFIFDEYEYDDELSDDFYKDLLLSIRHDPDSIKYALVFKNFEFKDEIRKLFEEVKYSFTADSSYNARKNPILFDISLNNNFTDTVNFAEYSILYQNKDKIIARATDNKYVINDKTPDFLLRKKAIIINSLMISPQSYKYIDFNSINFDYNEKKEIIKILKENNIFDFEKIPFSSYDFELVFNSIKQNPYNIDSLYNLSFNSEENYQIIEYIKERIKDNSYVLSEKTPINIINDYDIRKIVYKNYPQLIPFFPSIEPSLTDYEWAFSNNVELPNNPNTEVNFIIKNIESIDNIIINYSDLYTDYDINNIVEKLISINYKTSIITPKFLFKNNNFMIYAINNNMYIDPKMVERFLNFENIRTVNNKEITKKLFEMGYGESYKKTYEKYGLDQFIDIVIKYGDMLKLINYEKILPSEIDMTLLKTILNQLSKKQFIYEYLIRSQYIFSDEDIINGIYGKEISKDAKIMKYIVSNQPNKIILYKGNSEDVFEEAIRKGYIPTEDVINDNKYMSSSASVIKKYAEEDIERLFLYTGNSNSFLDIFDFKDKNGKQIEPNYTTMSRLSEFHNNDYVMKKAISFDANNILLYSGFSEELFEEAIKNNFVPTKELLKKYNKLCTSNSVMKKALELDINNIIYCEVQNESFFNELIDNGYIPTEEHIKQNDRLKNSFNIMKKAIEIDPKYIIYCEVNDASLFEIAIEKGYLPSPDAIKNYSALRCSYAVMKKAIEIDPNNVAFCELEDESLFEMAIKEGYKPTEEHLKINHCMRNSDSIFKSIIDDNQKNLYYYYEGENDDIINDLYKKIYEKSYDNVINENNRDNYINIWKSFRGKDTHLRLVSYLNKEVVEFFDEVDMDYYLILKYGINNPKMNDFISIINNNNLTTYKKFYNKIKNEYIDFDNNAFGVDLFLRLARLFNNNHNLSNDILSNSLNTEQVSNLILLIQDNMLSNINSIDELSNYEKNKLDDIKKSLLSDDITEIKENIIKLTFGFSLSEFKKILEYNINFDTIDKILKKIDDQQSNDYKEIYMLKTIFTIIEETVNSTSDIDSLKRFLEKLLDNNELLTSLKPIFYNIQERIRRAYEIDAQHSLTNLDKETSIRYSKTGNKKIIDLNKSEYVIYAHVSSNNNYSEFVNKRFNGLVTICVSPISNLGKKLYGGGGVVLGFTNIPDGGFIGSRNKNMGSNSYIGSNDYDTTRVHHKFYELEIKDSSSLTPHEHAETLLYRDGLTPTCILIRDEEPSPSEIEAQEELSSLLGYEIPFVHTQKIGTSVKLSEEYEKDKEYDESIISDRVIFQDVQISANPDKKEKNIEEYLIKMKTLRDKLSELDIKRNDVYDIIPMHIGGSHDMFKCHINGRSGVYYLKPGYRKKGGLIEASIDPYRSFAMKAAYDIQSIVNPEGAVYVNNVEVSGRDLNLYTDDKIMCSVIEVLEETSNYQNYDSSSELTDREMKSFLLESISDYLTFSYDTKGENFLIDKNGKTYGVDKEQALKFVLHYPFVKSDEENRIIYNTDYSDHINANLNSVPTIYPTIFSNVARGKQKITEEMYNSAKESIDKVEQISDEEYLSIFSNFINSFMDSSVIHQKVKDYVTKKNINEIEAKKEIKKEMEESLLARKHNLRSEFDKFILNTMEHYYINSNEEEEEWIKNMKTNRLN